MPDRNKNMLSDFTKHLSHMRHESPVQTEILILDLVSQGFSKGEIFRQLTAGKGKGKSHASGKPEDQLKDS